MTGRTAAAGSSTKTEQFDDVEFLNTFLPSLPAPPSMQPPPCKKASHTHCTAQPFNPPINNNNNNNNMNYKPGPNQAAGGPGGGPGPEPGGGSGGGSAGGRSDPTPPNFEPLHSHPAENPHPNRQEGSVKSGGPEFDRILCHPQIRPCINRGIAVTIANRIAAIEVDCESYCYMLTRTGNHPCGHPILPAKPHGPEWRLFRDDMRKRFGWGSVMSAFWLQSYNWICKVLNLEVDRILLGVETHNRMVNTAAEKTGKHANDPSPGCPTCPDSDAFLAVVPPLGTAGLSPRATIMASVGALPVGPRTVAGPSASSAGPGLSAGGPKSGNSAKPKNRTAEPSNSARPSAAGTSDGARTSAGPSTPAAPSTSSTGSSPDTSAGPKTIVGPSKPAKSIAGPSAGPSNPVKPIADPSAEPNPSAGPSTSKNPNQSAGSRVSSSSIEPKPSPGGPNVSSTTAERSSSLPSSSFTNGGGGGKVKGKGKGKGNASALSAGGTNTEPQQHIDAADNNNSSGGGDDEASSEPETKDNSSNTMMGIAERIHRTNPTQFQRKYNKAIGARARARARARPTQATVPNSAVVSDRTGRLKPSDTSASPGASAGAGAGAGAQSSDNNSAHIENEHLKTWAVLVLALVLGLALGLVLALEPEIRNDVVTIVKAMVGRKK